MLFPVEQAFVGRDEKRAPLKTPAWEARVHYFVPFMWYPPLLSTSFCYDASFVSNRGVVMLSTNMYIEYAFFKNTTILFYCQQQSYSGLRSPRTIVLNLLKILFIVPPKFCISIVFNFSWYSQSPQEKLKTMLMQTFGGTTKSIMVLFQKGLLSLTLGLS